VKTIKAFFIAMVAAMVAIFQTPVRMDLGAVSRRVRRAFYDALLRGYGFPAIAGGAFADHTTGGRVIEEGIGPVKITLSGTVKVGDLVGYSSGWKAADMNSSPKVYAELVAAQPGVSGDVITAFRTARVDFGSSCTATAGDRVYASTDAGQYVGSASNDQGQLVGVMIDAQRALINPYYALSNFKWPNTEYSNTSGSVIVQQVKAALAATGSASLTGLEIAPKVLDAVAAATISGVKVAIDLEGTSAGTVTMAQCFEANVGSDSGTSRTVTTAVCYRAINNCHGTITNGPFVIDVDAHGGNVVWGAFARLADVAGLASVTNGSTLNDISATANAGWVKVIIGSTVRYLAAYAEKA